MPMTKALGRRGDNDRFYINAGLAGGGAMDVKKKEIIKEGVSEYFIYTVEGRDTIPNGWSKRLPSSRHRMSHHQLLQV